VDITISVVIAKNHQGIVNIGVFDHHDSFPVKGKEFRTAKVKAIQDSVSVIIKGLPKGEYAVSVFLDENMDSICNTNFIGLPKEDYGFSRNFRPLLSAPSFEDCKLKIERDTTIFVELR
jgi:uncharacterized protein (DUF2141 family)